MNFRHQTFLPVTASLSRARLKSCLLVFTVNIRDLVSPPADTVNTAVEKGGNQR